MAYTPVVSFVVPTYNEEEDIRRTLDALVRMDYPHVEVIVVDDSTDRTPEIVRDFEPQGVRLIRPAVNRGRCGARNLGIMEATGDIVVVLNADVFPRPDFVRRLLPHYARGADFLLVESRVANDQHVLARYIQATHDLKFRAMDTLWWTEAFSCRREAAIASGLFPDCPIPLRAGEDAHFGRALARRFRKAIDPTIVVPHIAPHRLRDFWNERVSRGTATPVYKHFVRGQRVSAIAAVSLIKTLRACALVLPALPVLIRALRLSRHSARGRRDVVPFAGAAALDILGQVIGEWRSLAAIGRS